jgi:hypothetical protein
LANPRREETPDSEIRRFVGEKTGDRVLRRARASMVMLLKGMIVVAA